MGGQVDQQENSNSNENHKKYDHNRFPGGWEDDEDQGGAPNLSDFDAKKSKLRSRTRFSTSTPESGEIMLNFPNLIRKVEYARSGKKSLARSITPEIAIDLLTKTETEMVYAIEGKDATTGEDLYLCWDDYMFDFYNDNQDSADLTHTTDIDSILCTLDPQELCDSIQCDLSIYPFPNRNHTFATNNHIEHTFKDGTSAFLHQIPNFEFGVCGVGDMFVIHIFFPKGMKKVNNKWINYLTNDFYGFISR